MDCISGTSETYVTHQGWLTHETGDDVALFLRQDWFEAVERAVVWVYLHSSDIFLDCGAHVGLFSQLAGRIVGGSEGGRVVSVEPMASTARILRKNMSDSGMSSISTVIEAALGGNDGTATLVSQGDGHSAYNHLVSEGQGASVRVLTLGSLLKEAGVDRVDFLKMDIEGMELAAWQAAQMAGRRQQIGLAMVEFTEQNLKSQGHTSVELARAIEADGYVLCSLNRQTLQLEARKIDGPVWYDNLFVTANLDAVNARMAGADPHQKRIALDLLARDAATADLRATQDFKRLLENERVEHARQINALSQRLSEAQWWVDHAKELGQQRDEALEELNQPRSDVARLEETRVHQQRLILEREAQLTTETQRLVEMTALVRDLRRELDALQERYEILTRQELEVRERDRHARQLLGILLSSRYAKLGRKMRIFANSPEVDHILKEQSMG